MIVPPTADDHSPQLVGTELDEENVARVSLERDCAPPVDQVEVGGSNHTGPAFVGQKLQQTFGLLVRLLRWWRWRRGWFPVLVLVAVRLPVWNFF